jgi:type IV secretory pathway VirB4 component
MIIGRQGSGRSYAIKALLSNLFAEDARVFVADTENKYRKIAKKINGSVIDASDATAGRLNPLHVRPSMAGTATGDHGGFEAHLEFLGEFFGQLLPELDLEQRELLLALIANVYADKGISAKSDLYSLEPGDFPTLEDISASIDPAMSEQETPLGKALALIKASLKKLTLDIRGPSLYNGRESLSPAENFVAFAFRGLLENPRAAAAHLLLLLNWLEGEIVRNFEYNRMYGASRKIVVVLDEAHALFDPSNCAVQDALLRFAGRIARYNGMLALCTRNLKAFTGKNEAARKAAALAGACQYSFIFPIKPGDAPTLCGLFEEKAELSEAEREQITANPRGTAYVISGPDNRACVQIAAYPEVTTLI